MLTKAFDRKNLVFQKKKKRDGKHETGNNVETTILFKWVGLCIYTNTYNNTR